MNLEIRNVDCPKDKYSIKCPYAMTPTRIIIHNTANDASANNEVAYMHRNNKKVSFHFAVDDVEIIKCLPLNRNSWNAGDGSKGKGNREGISIEVCHSRSGGEKWLKALYNAAELTAELLKDYGWGIDKVTKHQDYSGKYCPHRILDEYGWDSFIALVESYLAPVVINNNNDVLEWQKAAIADGFKFAKYGADGKWGNECVSVAKIAICKKRLTYKYRNLTKIVQRAVGVTADGKFGNGTKNAVIKLKVLGEQPFQRETSFVIDGNSNAKILTIGECYCTEGNWAGFPPHKHDEDNMPTECIAEEIYYFLFDPKQGFAVQCLYTSDGELDEAYRVKYDELVEFPYGYHTTVATPGYQTYFLWLMAGDYQGFNRSNDPEHTWIENR